MSNQLRSLIAATSVLPRPSNSNRAIINSVVGHTDSPVSEPAPTVIQIAGWQRVKMTVEHWDTPEAHVVVSGERWVVCMHTSVTTDRLSKIWRAAEPYALRLPRAREITGPVVAPSELTEAELVVHTGGQPVASARLSRSVPHHLSVTIEGLAFVIYDQRAFTSCSEPFVRWRPAETSWRQLRSDALDARKRRPHSKPGNSQWPPR